MATLGRADRVAVADPLNGLRPRKRISWGAVIAGVVFALAIHMVLSMLGLGIGLTTIEPMTEGTPQLSSLGTGAAIWWVVSGLIATVGAGYVAARLSGVYERRDGILHGLVAWASVLLVSVWLLSSLAGTALGGAFNLMGNAVSGAAQSVSAAVPQAVDAAGITPEQIEDRVGQLLRANDVPAEPEQARRELTGLLGQVLTGQQGADQARQRAVEIVAQQAGIPPQEAEARIQQLQDEAEQLRTQAEETARQATEATAETLSQASLWSFAALVIGAIAAAVGGAIGTRREEDVLANHY
ncbi:hypothetical protein [Geminicoccus flavidas]|uniref:hypothetical protein n=1 Tax=Geminicoccus flavidas TaxID=2506407 RepID=UPI0013572F28|nr:hypothetical protein [Geminicoccus flavidas]